MKNILSTPLAAALLIGCSGRTHTHDESTTPNLQPEVDELITRVANLESRLTELELAADAADANTPVAVAMPPSTNLWAAAAKGDQKEIELHIAAGTKLDAKDNLGQTALHLATANNHAYVIKLLLANGANTNIPDEKGDTPLDWAVSWNRSEAADILRKHGAKTGAELKAEG